MLWFHQDRWGELIAFVALAAVVDVLPSPYASYEAPLRWAVKNS